MAGTRRHGFNALIYVDTTTGGTAAVGTATLTAITSKNSWSFDQSRDLVDVTSFGDTSKTSVAGLSGASGDFTGFMDFADTAFFSAIADSKERGLIIIPDATNNATIYISGKAFFSPKFGGSESGAVTLDVTFSAGPSGLTWTHP
jgi:hypothetical protein